MRKISYIRSNNRSYNIERCLALLKTDVVNLVSKAKKLVIKISSRSADPLYGASPEAMSALLAFIKPFTPNQITVLAGVTKGKTMDTIKHQGIFKIQDNYDFAIVDENSDDSIDLEVFDLKEQNFTIKLSKTLIESDCIISLAKPDLGDDLIFSGTVTNLIEPNTTLNNFLARKAPLAILRQNYSDKNQIPLIAEKNANIILSRLSSNMISLVDGYQTILEDDNLLPTHYSAASTDILATDWLACRLAGLKISEVRYLAENGFKEDGCQSYVVGDDWQKHILNLVK